MCSYKTPQMEHLNRRLNRLVMPCSLASGFSLATFFVPANSPRHSFLLLTFNRVYSTMVMFSRFAIAATLSALFTAASAELKILSPGGPNLWWGKCSTERMGHFCLTWLVFFFIALLPILCISCIQPSPFLTPISKKT